MEQNLKAQQQTKSPSAVATEVKVEQEEVAKKNDKTRQTSLLPMQHIEKEVPLNDM